MVAKNNTKKQEDKEEKVLEVEENFKDKFEDTESQLKRAVADYRNLEKRMQEEKRENAKYANSVLLSKMIPAFDTLFLAAKYTEDEGVKLTAKNLLSVLKEVGVEKIKSEGEDFNPQFMEAVEVVDGEDNKVIEEVRPGFTLFDKLLRPAHVKVGKADLEKKTLVS